VCEISSKQWLSLCANFRVQPRPLEEHFGRHRGLARRSTNPNIYSFGYQENKLRLEQSIATNITPKGNTKGLTQHPDGITVTTSPIKRKKEYSEYISSQI